MHQSLRLFYTGQCLRTDPPLPTPRHANCQQRATLAANSKFQGFESTQRRKCVQFVHKASRTDAEHVFFVDPSIAHPNKGSKVVVVVVVVVEVCCCCFGRGFR